MALITEKPDGLPGPVNDLDNVVDPDEVFETPAAFLQLGSTPTPVRNPPASDDVRTYVVRTVCTEEHGPLKRKKGDKYTRTLQIQAIWEFGQPEPKPDPEPESETPPPGLFNSDGSASAEATGEPQTLGEIVGDLSDDEADDEDQGDDGDEFDEFRPQFSDGD